MNNTSDILAALSPALDEHLMNIANVHHGLFYPENVKLSEAELTYKNEAFLNFCTNMQLSERVLDSQIARLKELHSALETQTAKLLNKSLEKQFKPDPDEFQALMILSDEFVSRLRNLENDCAREDSGIDPLTGLRSRHVLIDDLQREMSRAARRGGYFAVAIARIDGFEHIQGSLNQQDILRVYVAFAGLFKRTMRLYDDAYLLDNGYFALCLKHTDHNGSVAAVERILRLLKEQKREPENPFLVGDEDFSLSFIVANPEASGDMREFLGVLKRTLAEYPDDRDLILEHKEISQLERYMREARTERP